ncbi:hypothetical protein CLV51_10486 [Chitinophaga niastensis]|uniref:EthD domain-containing protein n=1 Tax=Chitinophaga niastensis TaxID=536980 RepID=A0A2P8HGP9_CHINA|nr:hypothetical protein [Chitinophaga niastensis]PSL45384.1 hypothetical protein CLV51_10486 [Chitinophaga niastensis]
MLSTFSSLFTKSKYLLLLFCSILSLQGIAQTKVASSNEYFTVENYYRAKWGYADEFIHLWKTNHYPLLKKAIEKGDIISVTAARPRLHSGEDTRWDFRVTIVFKNAALAFDENLTAPYKKLLYPDQEQYKEAEQHRFEILLSHWDVEVVNEALD